MAKPRRPHTTTHEPSFDEVEAEEQAEWDLGYHLPVKSNATYQDVLDAPEHKVAQIIDGDLYVMPRPNIAHSSAGSELGAKVRRFYHHDDDGGPGGWVILYEPEIHVTPENRTQILVPDIAGWRRSRMPQTPVDAKYIEMPPDWVCEILSPSTARIDRLKKCASTINARSATCGFSIRVRKVRLSKSIATRPMATYSCRSLPTKASSRPSRLPR